MWETQSLDGVVEELAWLSVNSITCRQLLVSNGLDQVKVVLSAHSEDMLQLFGLLGHVRHLHRCWARASSDVNRV